MSGDMKKVLDEIQKTTKDLHDYVDKKFEEVRSEGEARPETLKIIDTVNEQITELRGQYDDLCTKMNRPGAGNSVTTEEDEKSQLEKRAYEKFLRFGGGETGRGMMDTDEVRALSQASDADGGFLVPTDWENELITQAYNEGELRAIIGAKPTSRDTVFMPALSKPVVAWGTTNLAVDPQDLAAGGERITIYDLKALVLIHNNTLEDADADIWGELSGMFGMAVGEAEDDAYATGPGNNSPQGIVSDARVQANFTITGVAAGLGDGTVANNGVDPLINALYKLKKTYRRGASFAMNSTTEGAVRQFKDLNGQYLWQPPVQAGDPATLLGKPIANPEGMPDVAADSLPIVVGDFRKGYRIRDRKGITIQRLVERYAEYDQTGFLVKRRVGGQVVLPEAFQVIKVSA